MRTQRSKFSWYSLRIDNLSEVYRRMIPRRVPEANTWRRTAETEGKFSRSFHVRVPGRPFDPGTGLRTQAHRNALNTHFYQTLRGPERAGWKPISYGPMRILPRHSYFAFITSFFCLSSCTVSESSTRVRPEFSNPSLKKERTEHFLNPRKKREDQNINLFWNCWILT